MRSLHWRTFLLRRVWHRQTRQHTILPIDTQLATDLRKADYREDVTSILGSDRVDDIASVLLA